MRSRLFAGFALLLSTSAGCMAATRTTPPSDSSGDAAGATGATSTSTTKGNVSSSSSSATTGAADASTDGATLDAASTDGVTLDAASTDSATTNNPTPECQEGGTYAGNTWTDLYQCYFGPTAPDSCSGQGAMCHATAASSGGVYWVCGDASDSCYVGMTGDPNIDPTQDSSDPTDNGLYMTLCQTNGDGFMPYLCDPSAQLFPADMARIAAWIQAGGLKN